MEHLLPPQLHPDAARLILFEIEIGNGMLRAENRSADARDGLHDHARDVQGRRVVRGALDEGVHVDLVEAGHVAECDGPAEQGEVGPAAGAAQGPVFEVGGGAVPGAEAGGGGAGEGARGVVLVH